MLQARVAGGKKSLPASAKKKLQCISFHMFLMHNEGKSHHVHSVDMLLRHMNHTGERKSFQSYSQAIM